MTAKFGNIFNWSSKPKSACRCSCKKSHCPNISIDFRVKK